MFGFGKKKKEAKVEQVFESSEDMKENGELSEESSGNEEKKVSAADELIMGTDKSSKEPKISESQKKQMEQLGSVKDKIAKILKSSNIEIVDENIGDEYESSGSGGDAQQQQDYDSLKALFGGADDKKSKELTLTIDDFDYTYTGQYLDEFDMMHLKNIKRIRLQNKHAKLIKKIALIASIVIIVVSGAVAAFLLTRETPVYLKSISLNHMEGSYYINDEFKYEGLYIIAEYSDGYIERVKLKPSHLQDMTGNIARDGDVLQFTGTAPAELKFGYGGLVANYIVHIENKRPSGLKAIYTDGLFALEAGDLICSDDNLKLMLKHSNFGSVYFDYDNRNTQIYINNILCSYDLEKSAFVASASTKPAVAGERSSAKIVIVSNGFTLEITDVENQFSVEV